MSAPGDGSRTAAAPRPDARRRGQVVVAIAVVVVLLAGGVAFALLRNGQRTSLRLSFTPAQTLRYQVNSHDRGRGQAADSGYDTRTEAGLELAIRSVEPDGTAATSATVGPVTVRPSDLEPSDLGTLRGQAVRIAADGHQLDCILVVADQSGRFLSLMDPFLPFLPPGDVSPGDSWTVDARQALGVGTGGTAFTGTARLERLEGSGSQRVAVVEADLTETWDLTAGAAQVSRVGGGSAVDATGTVRWAGTERLHMTSRLDVARGVTIGTTVAGSYDLTITSTGAGNDAPLHNRGAFTQVARLVTR